MARHPWTLRDLLTTSRLGPYERAAGGDPAAALRLYDWNSRVSGAFLESLHYLEVGLRNAMDACVVSASGESWLSGSSGPLTIQSRRKVQQARGRAGGDEAGAVAHGKVVAELPFGFWWSLLSDEYNRRLWQPALRFAFDGPVRRRRLHAELDDLRTLRNRIAHHEPIHDRDLDEDLRQLLDVSDRIASDLSDHLRRTTRLPAVLGERPVGGIGG